MSSVSGRRLKIRHFVARQLHSSWIGSSLPSLLFSTDLKIVKMCYTCSHGSGSRSHLTITLGGKTL